MHHADIIAELKKAEYTGCKLAEELHVHPSMISLVIHGKATSKRIANRIATIINKSTSEIWPDGRYSARVRKAA